MDKVILDLPLFIRLLEVARENIKTDDELHLLVERVQQAQSTTQVLTMKNMDYIYDSEQHVETMPAASDDSVGVIAKVIRGIKSRLEEANDLELKKLGIRKSDEDKAHDCINETHGMSDAINKGDANKILKFAESIKEKDSVKIAVVYVSLGFDTATEFKDNL